MIIAGNLLSFAAACFTAAASWSRDHRRIYLFQAAQCLLLAAANIFFASMSGTITFLFCAIRNCLIARHRFTGKLCAVFLVLLLVLGLAGNNRGIVGLLPVAATALYTAGCYYAVKIRTIKINMIVNLVLFAIYDVFILDLVSAVVDAVSAVLAAVSLLRPEE